MRRTSAILLSLALAGRWKRAEQVVQDSDMYFIDTEGGHSTLYVSPPANRSSSTPAAPGTAIPTASWRLFKRPA